MVVIITVVVIINDYVDKRCDENDTDMVIIMIVIMNMTMRIMSLSL